MLSQPKTIKPTRDQIVACILRDRSQPSLVPPSVYEAAVRGLPSVDGLRLVYIRDQARLAQCDKDGWPLYDPKEEFDDAP